MRALKPRDSKKDNSNGWRQAWQLLATLSLGQEGDAPENGAETDADDVLDKALPVPRDPGRAASAQSSHQNSLSGFMSQSQAQPQSHRKKPPVHITISDDRSEGSDFEQTKRILIALKRPQAKKSQAASQTPAEAAAAANGVPAPISTTTSTTSSNNLLEGSKTRDPLVDSRTTATAGFNLSSGSDNPDLPDNQKQPRALLQLDNRKRKRVYAVYDSDNSISDMDSVYGTKVERLPRRRLPFITKATTSNPSLVTGTGEIRPMTDSSFSDENNNPMSTLSRPNSNHRADVLGSSEAPSEAPSEVPRLIDIAVLGIPKEAATSLEAIQAYLSKLRGEPEAKKLEKASKLKIIHRIIDGPKSSHLYFDRPRWVFGENGSKTLSSSLPMSSTSALLAKHSDIAFVVYRNYNVAVMKAPEAAYDEDGPPEQVKHTSEAIEPSTGPLEEAITKLLTYKSTPASRKELLSNNTRPRGLHSPYLPIYHIQNVMEAFLDTLSTEQRRQLRILFDYVFSEYADEYQAVSSLLDEGKIAYAYIEYLFKPDDLIVEGRGYLARGYFSTSWLRRSQRQNGSSSSRSTSKVEKWEIDCEHWIFDGSFSCRSMELGVDLNPDNTSEMLIDDMAVRPLRFAREVADRLRRRGEMFWKCRFRHLVSYHEDVGRDSHHSGDERFIIDPGMYRDLHKRDNNKSSQDEALADDLGPELMGKDAPPDRMLYLLPLTIKGYSLKRKKWLDLHVDRISDVVWNKDAFESLVLDRKAKRLIRALVSNQLEAEQSTDLISGKGTGLILLLHGGPGTGKTLTAESVAEIAEKPLYPVTCGDIGTEPEMVETYLESVLTLGKTWGCVVLLDEADVFLEQRSLEDLQRNALVSVFLRVLEYYDGILVLTSNRVGTFDEAFKSRIQLALHYPNLTVFQRTQIWKNFISRIEKLQERNVDFDSLMDHIEDLAQHKMNGREIRNVITTARQYANWEEETLDYKLLKDIIETTRRFDAYIQKLNGGYSQDQLAEDEGLRLQKYDHE